MFLERLTLATFAIAIRAESQLFLPGYKGAAFRGGFGFAFKRIVCPRHETDCIHARLGEHCIYSEVFETPVPPGSAVMRKYPHAPHPFVLVPPLEHQACFSAQQELQIRLVLIGRAIRWFPYFIGTLEELGRCGVGPHRSRFLIERVESHKSAEAPSSKLNTLVYDGSQRKVVGTPGIIEGTDFYRAGNDKSRMKLLFLTPVRIVSNGQLARALPFSTLFRCLIRRLALLSYFHCDCPADVNRIRELINGAEQVRVNISRVHWRDWKRYSTRQNAFMKLGGLVGEITYEGEMGPFLPFLRAGELTHVGKGTSFGLGKYVLREV